MSQRDRTKSYPGAPGDDSSSSASEYSDLEEASVGLPSWGSESPGARAAGPGDPPTTSKSAYSLPDPPPAREPLPQLGDAFVRPQTPNRPSSSTYRVYDVDDERGPIDDPYERLRRVASQPQRQVRYDDDLHDSLNQAPSDPYPALPPLPPVKSRSRKRSLASDPPVYTGGRVDDRRVAPSRSAAPQFSAVIAARSADERMLLTAAICGLVSSILMAVTLATRISSLPDWIPIHYNAAGDVDVWGTNSTLWRLPLFAAMSTIVVLICAWFVGRKEPAALNLGLVVTALTQAMCWIALFTLAW